MTRRPQRWQAEKARTTKALRELPKCAAEGCQFKAMGVAWFGETDGTDLCVVHAQRAQRERRT